MTVQSQLQIPFVVSCDTSPVRYSDLPQVHCQWIVLQWT